MIASDSDNVNIKKIDAEINRGFTNQRRGEQLIKMGFKVKFLGGHWNIMFSDETKLCELNTHGTKRDALEEALKYVKVNKL